MSNVEPAFNNITKKIKERLDGKMNSNVHSDLFEVIYVYILEHG